MAIKFIVKSSCNKILVMVLQQCKITKGGMIMKKTKELENEETSVSMDKILKIESLEDAKEFERIASGRKFCKRGTRVQDICEEEVENYICRTRGNLLLRWYLHRKMKKNKERLLLESRVTSVIRALAVAYIEENDEIDEEIVTKNVKNIILAKTKEYMSKQKIRQIGTPLFGGKKLRTNLNFKNKVEHTVEEFERASNKSIIIIIEEERLKNMDVLLFYQKKLKYLNCELIYYFS